MKTVVIFLLFAAVALKATAAPAQEALVPKVEVRDEPKPVAPAEEVVQHEEEKEELEPVYSQHCLPDWEFFRGSCVYMNRNYNSWTDAVSHCASFGATLVAVHSPLEYNHFQYMVGSAGFYTAWIGGYHFESSWRWHDGSLFDYDNFVSGGSSSTNKCLVMNSEAGKGWYSSSCRFALPSICQMKVLC